MKNKIDSLFFTRLFVPQAPQSSPYRRAEFDIRLAIPPTLKRLRNGGFYGKREYGFPHWFHFIISRLCYRHWECVAFPLYHGAIRRRSLRSALSVIFIYPWCSGYDHGACSGKSKQKKCISILQYTGEKGAEVAPARNFRPRFPLR